MKYSTDYKKSTIDYYKRIKKTFIVRIFFKYFTFAFKSCCKKIGFSLKKVKLEHRPKTRHGKIININNLLQEFYVILNKFELKDIICIDETSLNAFLIRKYGYSKKGTRSTIQTSNQNVYRNFCYDN